MRITILGTGAMARALGHAWAGAGHELVVAGRSPERAEGLARALGPSARAATPRSAARDADAVLLAVPWDGVADAIASAGGDEGHLRGTPLIDPTNAVAHGVGELLVAPGRSAAERIAELAVGARVVKALGTFPADHWAGPGAPGTTVPLCGDDARALETVAALVTDLGAVPVVLGALSRARQLEEVAGFVIGLAFRGADPAGAVPRVTAS